MDGKVLLCSCKLQMQIDVCIRCVLIAIELFFSSFRESIIEEEEMQQKVHVITIDTAIDT